MPDNRVPVLARAILVIALGAALPLAFAPAQDAPAPKMGKVKKPKLPKPGKTNECKLVETGKSICEKNAYGDEVCQPELIEECPKPL